MLDAFRDESIVIVDEVLALLQSKRTKLKLIRIGIGIFMSDLSLVGLLVAIYHRTGLAYLIVRWLPLLSLLGIAFLGFGLFLIGTSIVCIYRLDRKLRHFGNALHEMGFANTLEN